MALADILAAIKAQADKEIAILQEQAVREKESIRSATDKELASFEEDLKEQTKLKKEQMKRKAETMVEMERKKILLQEKRKALDSVYDKLTKEVAKLPADKKKKLEDRLKKLIAGRKGESKNSKDGGFVFVTSKSEEDYTFPHLVQELLRPQTELDVAAKLFS